MLCKHCDTRNDNDARFCRRCGTPIGTYAPVARQSDTIAYPAMQGPICPACIRANPAGAKYCVYCATSLTVPGASPIPVLQPAYAVAATPVFVSAPVALSVANPTSLVLRAVWFFFIGWWLGLVWTIFAWLFNLTLIGLPIGLAMLNMIPQVMTLQPRKAPQVHVAGSMVVVRQTVEHPLVLRAIWFLIVGWWASLLWMLVAWVFSASLLLLPIAFWMFNRVPTITTLAAEQ